MPGSGPSAAAAAAAASVEANDAGFGDGGVG